MRLHKIFLTLVCLTALSAPAQWKWLNPLECGFPVIQNQGWTEELGDSYVRHPQSAEGKERKTLSSKRTAEYATYAHDRRIRRRSI